MPKQNPNPNKQELEIQDLRARLEAAEDALRAIRSSEGKAGSTITRDVTGRKREEEALRESAEHFRSLFENMLNGFAYCKMHFEQNQPQDFTYLDVNRAFEALTGLKQVVGKRVSEVIPGIRESDPGLFELYGRVALTGKPERIETLVVALGMWFSIAVYSPRKEYFVAVFDVITERKQAEMELRRVNRALQTTSACNQVIVRAMEEFQLLQDMCGILVREGGYRMAWVGYAEHDEGKSVRPVAHAGFDEGYLQAANITWADTERGRGPMGTAIRTRTVVLARNTQTEPSLARWREEQLKRGYASGIALPILLNDSVFGALTIYAEAPDAFDPAEIQLLTDLAQDLAYGIQTLRTRAERKRAEEDLRKSEDKFRSLVSNIPDVAWTMDAGLRFTFISENIETISGFSLEEIQRQGIALFIDSVHPEDVQRARDGLQLLFAEGRPYDVELRVKRKDGKWIWIHDRALNTYERNGTQYADGVLSDITERKQAEEALRLTQFSVEHASDAIFWMDPQGRILYVNEAACHSLGWSREELLSLTIPDIDPLVPKEAWRATWEAMKARGSRVFETQHRTKQGRYFPVEVTANYLNFRGKEYSFAFARDLTERKRAEAENVRLVTAIEQSAEAVMIANTSGDIEYVNPAFTRITGYSREEVLGQNPRILKSGQQDPVVYQQLWASILRGNAWQGEIINRRKDGSLFTDLLTITPVRNARGEVTHFIATNQDVTEHKQLVQQLIQAQKMEAVGRLAGGVAHDFNNLLTIINGYAQLLMQRSSPEDPRRGLFEEILTAGERAASLTRQLLAFSRRQVLEPKVIDLSRVLANTENMLRRLIGEDVELVTTLKAGLAPVKVDPGQIEQVIMNLAVNARDAMPKGGQLLIETANVEVDENYARSHLPMSAGKYVMLAVRDTGCGMDPQTQAHLFEPFFTTKPQGQGTGLGLATVYGIIKQSGGFIWVESEPGQGSTFKIYFPCLEEGLPTPEPAKVRGPARLARGKETILVVEDEAGVRSLVRETLKSKGYHILEAEGAAQALEIAERHSKPIHLLLTDVVMPHIDGKELAERLRTLHPETKVLYMSGYTDDAVARRGIAEGGTPFLQKPFLPDALLLKVREVLKRKRGTRQ